MVKKKEENKFNLEEALKGINPYLKDGFLLFIQDKSVKSQKTFDKYLKQYGGFQ